MSRRPSLPVVDPVAEMRVARYEPEGPYPGRLSLTWKARCMDCGRLRHVTLSAVRSGARCKHAHHEFAPELFPPRVAAPGPDDAPPPYTHHELDVLLRKADYEYHMTMDHEGRECVLVTCKNYRCREPALILLTDVHPGMPGCSHLPNS